MWFTLLITSSFILLSVFKYYGFPKRDSPKYPPGPWGLPFLGYMPFMGLKPLKTLHNLSKKYGDIFTIFLGGYRVVVLNSYHVVREAFKEDTFSGRPNLKMLEMRNGGVGIGLVSSQGRCWAEQRKFTMRQLKELGFGKRSMEGLFHDEVDELIRTLRKDLGKGINLQNRFNLAVLNALWRIICGKRYNHDDTRLQKILTKTTADLAETKYIGPLFFLPWLLKIAPGLTRWNEFVSSINSVHQFLKEIISEHKEKFNHSEIKDFIDAYLLEISETNDSKSSFYKERGEHSLLVVLLDLFMAGGDTTSSTLYWAFLFLSLNQHVQIKVQQEIDDVIGKLPPSLEHKKLMPYTEATIMEVLRKSSLVPMGLFHSTTSSTEFFGYRIAKDTVIIANFYHLNHDRGYWKDPETFRPERFLRGNNTSVIKYEALMPFSTGKRACPGENLARDQLFLFMASLLQQFTFVLDPSKPRPPEEPNLGIILTPKPYSVIVLDRSNKTLQD